jgi:hypothetical protein
LIAGCIDIQEIGRGNFSGGLTARLKRVMKKGVGSLKTFPRGLKPLILLNFSARLKPRPFKTGIGVPFKTGIGVPFKTGIKGCPFKRG